MCGVREETVCREVVTELCTNHQGDTCQPGLEETCGEEVHHQQECHTDHVRRCFTPRRGRRSPQLLQVLLLAQALNTRHPERAQEKEVRCRLVPHTTCLSRPVTRPVNCEKVSGECDCRQVSRQHCSVQPLNTC